MAAHIFDDVSDEVGWELPDSGMTPEIVVVIDLTNKKAVVNAFQWNWEDLKNLWFIFEVGRFVLRLR